VRAEDAVLPFRAERLIEHAVDAFGIGDLVFIHEMSRRLISIDDRAVEIGEAHGEARTGHESRAILNPFRRPVVIILIQPEPEVKYGD